MKTIKSYIKEGLKITSKTKVNEYNYWPKDKKELSYLMKDLIKKRGNEADFNDIDVSNVEDMSYLFYAGINFNGAISNWNVSNVKNMRSMFAYSNFNGDISNWNVSNVTDMVSMFGNSKFNGDISKWDVSNVTDMAGMFEYSQFNGDVSKWDVSKVKDMGDMFKKCPLKNKPSWYKKWKKWNY